MKEYYDKQNEEIENEQDKLKNKTGASKNIARPNIAPPSKPTNPTYTVKAPKK
jgi:hypothetical protein